MNYSISAVWRCCLGSPAYGRSEHGRTPRSTDMWRLISRTWKIGPFGWT